MVIILMMPAKIATPGLLKKKVFWNKFYDVILFIDDVTNKILLLDSNYIIDAFMWPKFGNCSIPMREVITNSKYLTRKTAFFEEWFWFNFNNLGLALGTDLQFYTNLTKRLKLKVRKFWMLIPTFVEVTGEKLVGGVFATPPFWTGLKT